MSANPSLLSSLHWVQGELVQSLTRVRTLIEQHMEAPDSQLPLQQAVVELHQVRGTASMIQCSGLVALTDEMKLALQDLMQGRIAEPEPAYAALLGASVQLGDYIDALASGLEDSVLVFQPAINELRLARGKPVLSEAELFAEQQVLASTPVTLPPGEARRPGSAQAASRKFQLVFQQNLLQWMKGQDVQLALGRLGKVAEQIAASAATLPVYQLWRMAAAVAEALLTKGLDDAPDLKRLYGRAAGQLKALAEQGEDAAAESAGALPYQFLYYVGRSRSQGPRVSALRQVYPLTRLLPTAEALEALRQKIRGPNTTLLTRLSEEIRNDLTEVKDNIDLVVRAGDKGPADLNSTVEKLNRVAVTLSMLGLGALQASIQAQARVLAGIQPRTRAVTDPVWLDVATALLRVEHSLDDALFRQLRRARSEGAAPDAPETGIPDYDRREGREALLREMLVDIAKLKTLVDGYLKVGDASALADGARLLGHIESSLHVLGSERAAALVAQLRGYIASPSFAGVRVERAQAERFADAIAAIEYYLEALQTRQPEAERMVDALASAVERLELGALPEPAPPTALPARSGPPAPPPSMAADEVDPEIREIFLEEAQEVLGQLRRNLPVARRDLANREAWTDVRRSFHTLKGSGRMVGARDIGEFAWAVENLLNRCLEGTRPLDPSVVELVEAAIGALPGLIDHFRDHLPVDPEAHELQSRAHRLAKGEEGPPDDDVLKAFCADARARLAAVRGWLQAQDPAMSEFPIDDEVLRAVHTIRGSAALVNAQGIGGLAAEFEKYLNALRAAKMRLPATGLRLLADAEPAVGEWVERLAQGDVAEPDLKPWLRRLAEVQATLPAGSFEAAVHQDSADQFANEAFTRLEEVERTLKAWSDHAADDFHPRELQAMFQTLAADAATAQCEPLGRAASAFQQRLVELAAGGFQPEADFFRDAATLVEEMYCQLDAFREGTLHDDGTELAARIAGLGTSFAHTEDIEEIPPVADPADELASPAPAEALETAVDPELMSVFLAEADELLEALDRQFATLESDARAREPLAELARALHTLKGGARMAGLEAIATVSHRLETLLEQVAQGRVARDAGLHARLHNAMDGLYRLVDGAKRGDTPEASAVLAELEGEGFAATPAAVPAAVAAVAPPPVAAAPGVPSPAPASAAALDPELVQVFTAEAAELLEALESSLADWQRDAGNDEALREMQRALHTLKGGARMAGLLSMGTLAHEMESRVEEIAESTGPVDAAVLGALHVQLEQLQRLQDRLARGEAPALMEAAPAAGAALEPEVEHYAEPGAPAAPAARGPWDPALFWRPDDAREGMAARQRETARVGVEQLDKMLNEASEISIYRSRLEQHNSALQFQLNEMQQTLERVREHLRGLDIETETQIAARGFSQGLELDADKRAEFDPLEMDRYSRMQELSRTLSESIGDLAALRGTMEDQLSEAGTLLIQQGRVNTEVQQGLMATLMVPFSRQVQRLQRVVRQTAQEIGKQAEVRFEGIEQELDRNVLERMVAPLEHLLRNSVVHGIEDPARRRAAGKPETGAIHVALHREGSQLAIEVRDDGQGLNYAAIRKTAIERGLMAADAELRDQEVAMFIFEAGFSTAREVTQAAGRGVGMDVVASEVKQLGGALELSSEAGQGARFVIRLPLTLALSQALLVGVGPEAYAVPLPAIESIGRVPRDKLAEYLRDDGPAFTYSGQDYGVQSLADLLEVPHHRTPDDSRTLPAVLVRLGEGLTGTERRVALVVDTLLGNREIVSKAVGPQVSAVQGVSGATILPDGRVVLIIDVPALVTNRARRAAVEAVHPAEAAAAPLADERPTVMVVDDSITIRRVTERLLERAGYRVVLAKDGLDAMTQLQTELPAAMLLDIEMPRADGFEVAAFVRNNERLKAVPIIMITSRSGEKHRERARQLGVNRYVIKPYQEEALLAEVREMVQGA